MLLPLWTDDGLVLSTAFPLPLDRPFSPAQAEAAGVSRQRLRSLVERGYVRRVLRGVYVATQAPNDQDMRCAALSLVVPDGCVVTDRTAAWLLGVEILPRTAPVTAPPLDVFRPVGDGVHRRGLRSGKRGLIERDVMQIGDLRVTTPLRTALDLGRLLWRFDALTALDGFARAGVSVEEMTLEARRFKGFRGVRQLRPLLAIADGRSESPGESALRLHWYDAGLPRPTPQHWVYDEAGVPIFRLDLALPALRYAAEYDGLEFHSSDEQKRDDADRRRWLTDRYWTIDVFGRDDVYRMNADPGAVMRGSVDAARAGLMPWQIKPSR